METNKIYYGDCIEGLKKLQPESVDHFYADPPFDIDFNKAELNILQFRRNGSQHSYYALGKLNKVEGKNGR